MGEEPNHTTESLVLYKSFNALCEPLYLRRCLQYYKVQSILSVTRVYNVKIQKAFMLNVSSW
jgi:hypothetical protein